MNGIELFDRIYLAHKSFLEDNACDPDFLIISREWLVILREETSAKAHYVNRVIINKRGQWEGHERFMGMIIAVVNCEQFCMVSGMSRPAHEEKWNT